MEITINGRVLALDEPVTILEAARGAGITIPTLCWHPRVSVLGACRLCLVEVEGINRLLAACTTQASDKMEVRTDTPLLRKVRQTMLELLLCRHPMDCPTCVKGGECELQELAYRYSAPENRFPENPAPLPVKDPSPFVERDSKKCVLCRRCVRVCHEVRGVTVLGAMHRGCHKEVGTFFHEPLDHDFQDPYNCEVCGACIDICPVGALNSSLRKFRARTWEGSRHKTVCPFCSVGCLLTLQVKEGEVVRTVPRPGPNNEDQACFRGRFGVDYANSATRLITPLAGREGGQVPVDRAEAVRRLAAVMGDGGTAEVYLSSGLTSEEAAAAVAFAGRFLSGAPVRCIDSRGLDEAAVPAAVGARRWEEIDAADLVVVAGEDFTRFEPVAGVRIRLSRARSGAALAVVDPRDSLLGAEAGLWLRPAGAGVPLLMGALLRLLAERHAGRLSGTPAAGSGELPAPEAAERAAGVPAGSLAALAERIAGAKRVAFVSHRGWYDPEGRLAPLLEELDRLLNGGEAGGIFYLRADCNSRGVLDAAGGGAAVADAPPATALVIGGDPLGASLPGAALAERIRGAKNLVVFDSFITATVAAASLALPLPTFAEKDGSFTAANGLVQRLEAALPLPGETVPLAELLRETAQALGGEVDLSPPAEGPGAGGAAGGGPAGISMPSAPPETWLVLHRPALADGRLELVPGIERLRPVPAVHLHPDEAAARGLEAGAVARVVSGTAAALLPVSVDRSVPRGQVCLVVSGDAGELDGFLRAAERVEGWPAACRRLTSIAPGGAPEEPA